MRTLLPFLLLALHWSSGRAQSAATADSLFVATRLNELSKPNLSPDTVESALYSLLALPVVGQQRNLHAEVLYALAKGYFTAAQYLRAADTLQAALDWAGNPLIADTMLYTKTLSLLGISKGKAGDVAEEIRLLDEAILLRAEALGPEHPSMGSLYFNLGAAYLRAERYWEAAAIYEQLAAVRIREYGPTNLRLHGVYNNLGWALKQSGDLDGARACIEKIWPIIRENYAPDDPAFAKQYESLGNIYDDLGDYERAAALHRQALAIRRSKLGDQHDDTAGSYFNLANELRKSGEIREALEAYDQALRIYVALLGDEHSATIDCLRKKGLCYLELGEMRAAEELLSLSLQKQLQIHGAESLTAIDAISSMGLFYQKNKQFEKAENYLQQARQISEKYRGAKDFWTAETIYYLGLLYQEMGEYSRSDDFFRSALQALNVNPDNPDPDAAENPFLIYHPLAGLGENAGRRGAYARVMYYFQQGQRVNSLLWRTRAQEQGKDQLLNNEIALTAQMLQYSFDQGQLRPEADKRALLAASGRCKAVALLSAVKNARALEFSGVSSALLAEEKRLRLELIRRQSEKSRIQAQGRSATDDTLIAASTALREASDAYTQFIERLENTENKYFQLKYKTEPDGLAALQQSLAENQTLLEYFVSDSRLYLFVVRKDTLAMHATPLATPDTLRALVAQLRRGLTLPGGRKTPLETDLITSAAPLTQAAVELYRLLIAPVEGLLGERLVVIPDGPLGYIPFDVLLPEMPLRPDRFHTYRYLGKEKKISYAYSAGMWLEMKNAATRPPAEPLLAMAPFASDPAQPGRAWAIPEDADLQADTLGALSASEPETQAVARIFSGRNYLGGQATAARFKETAGAYRMIHLSTHAKADEQSGAFSWLAFADAADPSASTRLYVRDLYGLTLHAETVVLSACETGLGRYKRGEGIISLARAFAYAGARSIVTSLWSVDDTATADLMRLFYENLKSGADKDHALWQAKKDYLSGHEKSGAHPFYWCGFILVGDVRKMD
jgi:CHAT domain-containing protein